MKSGLAHVMSDVEYTYLSKINNVRSIVDHFLLTDNLFNTILTYKFTKEITFQTTACCNCDYSCRWNTAIRCLLSSVMNKSDGTKLAMTS